MNTHPKYKTLILYLCVWAGMSVFAIYGLDTVPFHPDESTYIYMSSDFERSIQDAFSLAWHPERELDAQTRYRLIDAPLARYLIGVARWLFNAPALPSDWDWGKTWEENRVAGALPPAELLNLARFTLTALLPVSLLLVYLVLSKVVHPLSSALALVLLGSHALILLHARRSMAEGALLFGILLTLWSFNWIGKHPCLAGLATAVAFNAKHSALALLLVGIFALCYMTRKAKSKAFQYIENVGAYLIAFLVLTLFLNPVYWSHPFQGALATLEARRELLTRQTQATSSYVPEGVINRMDKRLFVLIANLFIQPPSYYEVGNYAADLQTQIEEYQSHPYNRLCRNLVCGGASFALSTFGFLLAARKVLFEKKPSELLWLLLSTIAMAAFLLVTVPLPWQRYSLPMVPFAVVWTVYGVDQVANAIFAQFIHKK